MAQISLIQLDIKDCIQESPISAVAQDVIVYDTAVTGSTQCDQHRCLCFRRGVDVQNPYALWEFTVPTQYVGTTGLTLVFNWWSELPLAAGAVVWEFAGQCLTAATAANTISLDAWGTPALLSAATTATTAGQLNTSTINLVKANVGNQVPAIGSCQRVRLRRMNTAANPTDTLTGACYVIGSPDLQGY